MSEQNFGNGDKETSDTPPDWNFSAADSREITDYIIEVEEAVPTGSEDASPYLPGQDFAEHRLVECVGGGLLSDVWQAFDPNLQCQHAIKIMRPDLAQKPELVEQFFVQARAQAKLQHPNVLQVLRVGRWEGTPYFVADWAEGEPLEQRLNRDGALSPVMAWDILRQSISALAYALDQGIIHRDLHPGNLMLEPARIDAVDRRMRVKIKDFGLATILDAPAQGKAAVLPGSRPEYSAPEIVTGMEIDFRSDIYSLGILLYHMLTGIAPYQGAKRGEILFKQVHDPLPALPPLVRDAIGQIGMQILARMTQKRPDLRYSSYEELLDAVEASPVMMERRRQALTPAPDLLTPIPPGPTNEPSVAIRKVRPAPPSKSKAPLLAVVVLLLVGGVTAAIMMSQKPGRATDAPASPIAAVRGADSGTAVAPAPALAAGSSSAQEPETTAAASSGSPPSDAASAEEIASLSGSTGAEPGKPAAGPSPGPPPALSEAITIPAPTPTPSDWSKLVSATPATGLNEIVVDNATPGALRLEPSTPGTWRNASLPGAHAYSSLLVAADATPKSATFIADIPRAGKYDLFLSWIPGDATERLDSVVCTIHTAEGPFKGAIDQTGSPTSTAFFPIGSYELAPGTQQPVVTLTAEDAESGKKRMLSVDALKLVFAGAATTAETAAPEEASAPTQEFKLPAGAIVVESGLGGKNREQYREIKGKWIDSRTPPVASKSQAYGLTPISECAGRKCVWSVVGDDTPAPMDYEARFSPGIEVPAKFHVYVTWPHGGNAAGIEYVVNHAGGATKRSLSQDGYGPGPGSPNNANVWIHLGEFEFKPGQESFVSMIVKKGTRAIHTTANGQAYADAVCFSALPLPDAQEDDRTTLRSVMTNAQAKGVTK